MTVEEKREQRNNLKKIRSDLDQIVSNLNSQINALCHVFTEADLISLGWERANFSGAYMAHEYKKGNKYIIFLDKSSDVLSYDGSQSRFFEDMDDLAAYAK